MKKTWLSTVLCLALLPYAVAQLPVAAFTATPQSGCEPLRVGFRDESSGDPKFWSWDFGNGEFSNLQHPVIAYSSPGTYTVTLVVRNGNGTHGITKTNYITVNPSPVADFTSDITVGCIPSTIQFRDLSIPRVGTITRWEWDFGDGTTSTQQHPQKIYTAVGFYNVTLKITSSTGCEHIRSAARYIRIVPGVTADFSFTPPPTCRPPFLVNFTNLSSGPGDLTYQWDFGNSTSSTLTDPPASYAASGTYNVTLTVRSEFGCVGTIQKPVAIDGPITDFNSPDTVCLNVPVDFQNTSTPAPLTSHWNFGNGEQSDLANGTSTYPIAGNYSVKLINTYSTCIDSITKPLVVSPRPTVDFTGTNLIACKAPLTASFQDISPDAVSWQWDFGDGSTSTQQHPSHQYTTEGDFHVTLTITSRRGCVNTITKNNFVRIIKPSVAIANAPNGGCVPFTYTALPNATAIDGIAAYFWDFGNGVTSTSATPPPVVYATPGNYTLKLKIRTNGGCEDSVVIVDGIRTGTPPVVDFSMATPDTCATALVQFTDLSVPPVDDWTWEFGDGETSSAQHPSHRYADTGTFTVRLTSYNNRCPGTAVTRTIHIKPPVAAFDMAVSCANQLMVSFTNRSKVEPAYGAISYLWEFGDPGLSSSTDANPVPFTYPALGTYTVRLTTTNGACQHTISQNVQLVGESADFTVSKAIICKNERVTVTATGNPANISQYEWSIDGGATWYIDQRSIELSYPDAGIINITLRITDINGCTNTKTIPAAITVTGPVANFTAGGTGGCINTSISFNDLSTPAGGITKWTFNFGDGRTQSFTNPPFTHTYTDTGKFVIQLTVEDNAGCTHTFEMPDTLRFTKPVPGFSANYTTICPLTDIQFTDTSSGSGLTYAWDFGDGNTSALQHPVHAYAKKDTTYTVKLVIRDDEGCADSVVRNNYIAVKAPKPAFGISDTTTICPPIETKFTFRGQDYESFYWDFGDGSTSTLANPNHFYNDYGKYTAKLYLVGYGGCLDSISDTVRVYDPYLNTTIAYNAPVTCDSLTVDFTITTPPSTRFTFYFGDGALDSTQARSLRHFYSVPNFYAPYLVLKDNQDCEVTVGGPATIRVVGAAVLFGMDKNSFCDSGTVYFTDYTQQRQDPIRTRTWDFGDGVTSTDQNPIYRFRQPGTYEVTLTMTTDAGCTSVMADTVRVYGTPAPLIVSDDIVCINEVFALQGTLAVPDTAITWSWDLGGGGPASINQNTSAVYSKDGNYTVRLEAANKLGCRSNTSKNIIVKPIPAITVTNEPVIPVGTGTILPVTYGPGIATYTWTPPSGLSCTDCPNPFANPKLTTTYTVNVEDIYGCTNSQSVTVTVICNDRNYFIPNTFSPNGDGHNDIFYPRGSSITRISSMKIFNRWGELIFEKRNFSANDASAGWNGLYKGKPATQDVYVYAIEFICENAAIIPFKGNVMLVR